MIKITTQKAGSTTVETHSTHKTKDAAIAEFLSWFDFQEPYVTSRQQEIDSYGGDMDEFKNQHGLLCTANAHGTHNFYVSPVDAEHGEWYETIAEAYNRRLEIAIQDWYMRHSESVTITENVPELGYLLIATHEGHVQLIEDCDPDEINDILDGKPITAEFVRGFLEVASMMLDGSPEDLKIYAPFDRGIDTDEWVKSIDSGAEFNGGWLIGKVLYQIVPTVVW